MDRIKVLLIDDNDHQLELFYCYVSQTDNITLFTANAMEEAIPLIETEKPNLIFLDNRLLPYESYEDTVPIIRSIDFKGKIVVISADISKISSTDLDDYCITSCMDKFDFNLDNFGTHVHQLMAA